VKLNVRSESSRNMGEGELIAADDAQEFPQRVLRFAFARGRIERIRQKLCGKLAARRHGLHRRASVPTTRSSSTGPSRSGTSRSKPAFARSSAAWHETEPRTNQSMT